MTLEEFLAALEKTPRDWHIESDGAIRTGRFECPACKVSNEIKGTHFALAWEEAAHALGMKRKYCWEIAAAADDEPGHDPELRARLLKACGLALSFGAPAEKGEPARAMLWLSEEDARFIAAARTLVPQLLDEVERLTKLVQRAHEELRLIHMKDCGAIYDVGLRAELGEVARIAELEAGMGERK